MMRTLLWSLAAFMLALVAITPAEAASTKWAMNRYVNSGCTDTVPLDMYNLYGCDWTPPFDCPPVTYPICPTVPTAADISRAVWEYEGRKLWSQNIVTTLDAPDVWWETPA